MPRWWSLILSGLNWTRVAPLTRVSPGINLFHVIATTWSSRSLRSLLVHNHKMVWLHLELILLVEGVLTHLLILRVKSIEVIISLVEKVDHTRSHTAVALIPSESLIQ